MLPSNNLLPVLIGLLLTAPAVADHHSQHNSAGKYGPNGGVLVPLGEEGISAELAVEDGELLTVRVLDENHKAIGTGAELITFTFIESDGEEEDYEISAKKLADGESVFQRKSSHVVQHVVRDKFTVKATVGGKELTSKTYDYQRGPHGGQISNLGDCGLLAELVIKGDSVRVYVLDSRKRPKKVSAKELTLTFTEPDGEEEDYQVSVMIGEGRGTVFERKSGHVVEHVKRDQIKVTLPLQTKVFKYTGP